jgi:hypothetical protein
MSVIDDSVHEAEDGTFGFFCPGVKGSGCGDAVTRVPFSSTGWPTAEIAAARGQEHFDEHLGKSVTSSLEEFRAKHGLVVDDATGAVSLADLEA